jgi:MGT family glycosyltransferase
MAKFLIATAVAAGHVTPVAPISSALVESGHQVVWIGGRIHKGKIESTGAQFHPWPEEIDLGNKSVYEAFPALEKLNGLAQVKWYLKHAFLDLAPPQNEAIGDVLKFFSADVLIGDPAILGVYFISEVSGIPSVFISLIPPAMPSCDTAPYGLGLLPHPGMITQIRNRTLNWLMNNALMNDVNTHANMIRQQLNLPPLQSPFLKAIYEIPALILQLSTPAFEYPRRDLPATFRYIGPVLPRLDPSFAPPGWWTDLQDERPKVLITQGTVETSWIDLIIPAIEGLKNEDVMMIAVLSNKQAIKSIPDNLRVERFIPFTHILPFINVMVTNGGYGGVQQALALGVPLVVAGATEEKMEVAARVEWSGAGINLRKQHPTPAQIQTAVKKVLGNPVYRENAKRIQRDFAQHDAPNRAVQLLESLVESGRK